MEPVEALQVSSLSAWFDAVPSVRVVDLYRLHLWDEFSESVCSTEGVCDIASGIIAAVGEAVGKARPRQISTLTPLIATCRIDREGA